MPTKDPRVNVVLEKTLYNRVRRLAEKEEVSLSLKIRDLVRQALETEEDSALAEFAEGREKTITRSRGVTHRKTWGS
ncbi:MAG: toxin-antitoxin system, antitoxin component [Candidatus Binatia bacterium]